MHISCYIHKIVVLILLILCPTIDAIPMLYSGNIQFPSGLKNIPSIRVYYCGTKIKTEQIGNSVSFSIPEDRQCLTFWLLITEHLSLDNNGNTINHLTVDNTLPYKLYRLTLVKKEASLDAPSPQPEYTWRVEKIQFSRDNTQIPDTAIIVYYNADFVEKLEGGNAIELPKIIIRSDVLKLAGSEAQLHEDSIALILSSLDYDTVHANPEQAITKDKTGSRFVAITT